MKLTSKLIKEYAIRYGADIVGIGDISRFDGTAHGEDPRYVFPEAKSIIGLGFRQLRGSYRGVEEGTTYFHFVGMSVLHLEEVKIPTTLLRIAGLIEDSGYDAVIQRSVPDLVKGSVNPEKELSAQFDISSVRPKTAGKPAPEVMMDFKQAAAICGLGEIGLSGHVLTDKYGPFQRFGFILTDAELDADPVQERSLCDECEECIKGCFGNAFSTERENVNYGGVSYSLAKWDEWQCAVYYAGAYKAKNPFMPEDALETVPDREKILQGEKKISPEDAREILPQLMPFYPPMRHDYLGCICGRACDRACYIHLENKGLLTSEISVPFRKREDWFLET